MIQVEAFWCSRANLFGSRWTLTPTPNHAKKTEEEWYCIQVVEKVCELVKYMLTGQEGDFCFS